ncbi:Adhesin BmaC autotransporter [Pandoraea soli]|uniref:Adhesin BmaC autotransporter n=1 Tax=Pandoraea soli TaxID=2508293 RepID=A0ABY6W9U0_9BURK|nr:Adhesin BmaC autotransporter [Pandoraea soli]
MRNWHVAVNDRGPANNANATLRSARRLSAECAPRGVYFKLSCIALAVAGALPGASHAATYVVNSQTELIQAINNANASSDASATIQLGSSFAASGTLPTATKAITLDTQGFTLSGSSLVWSGTPITFAGTLVGTGVGATTARAGINLNGVASTTSFVNNGNISGAGITGGVVTGVGAVVNAASLVNNGTITGGSATTIAPGGAGAQIGNGAVVTNNGLIQGGNSTGGAGGTGVNWSTGGATLVNHGTIQGGADLTGVNTTGGIGVAVRAAGSPNAVVNTGTIVGGNGGVAIANTVGVSIVNSGLIQAGAGQSVAIRSTTVAAFSLELQAGSTIVGNVVASAAGTNNAFILGGSTNAVFDVSTVGSTAQYQNFNTYTKTGTGTWSLTGTGITSTPWTISQGTLQIGNGGTSGSVIGNITDNATLAFNRSDTLTFDNLVGGTGGVNQLGSGTTVLTAANTYTGDTNVLAGTLAVGDAAHATASIASAQTSVAAGATLGGYGTVSGAVTNSGTVAVGNALSAFATSGNGTFTIGGNLTNAGTVNLAAASGVIGNTLNVAGNYIGANGLVALNTVINEGGAATQTDRLIVAGNTGGDTALKINGTGTGVLTVGDGIRVVQVGGTSATNSFRLASALQAGAYEYLLYRGGTTGANDWYLRSYLLAPASTGSASTTDAPIAYRPGIAGYAVAPQLNTDYGFSILGRLNERVRDIANPDPAPEYANGVWGRIGGQNLDAEASDRYATNERTFFAQIGRDWTLAREDDGASTHAGATMTFGSSSASFTDRARSVIGSTTTGSVQTQAQSIGGYWTRYAANGSYFDGVGQLTHYQNRYADIYGVGASQNGFGAGLSGEIGQRMALGSTGVAIEPQAQLLYQYVHLNGFGDGISPVGTNTTNALRGRIGFRLLKSGMSNAMNTSTVTPYFAANVLHDFFSPGQTTVSGIAFPTQLGKTWYDVGVGLTGSFGKRSQMYASVKYEHSIGGAFRRNVFGQVGYQFAW